MSYFKIIIIMIGLYQILLLIYSLSQYIYIYARVCVYVCIYVVIHLLFSMLCRLIETTR